MVIKKWKSQVQKNPYLRKEVLNMMNVINMNDYKQNPNIKIDVINMMFNRDYREKIYSKYDEKYESTQEEDDIFEEMRGNFGKFND